MSKHPQIAEHVSLLLDAKATVSADSLQALAQRSPREVSFHSLDEIAKQLVPAGAEVKGDGWDAFLDAAHRTSLYDNAACIELLRKAGADPNARDSKGRTCLMLNENIVTSDVFDKLGVDINAQDNEGRSAFMHMATQECPSAWYAVLVKAFLKHGAKTDLRDKNGLTLYQQVKEKQPDYITILEEEGIKE